MRLAVLALLFGCVRPEAAEVERDRDEPATRPAPAAETPPPTLPSSPDLPVTPAMSNRPTMTWSVRRGPTSFELAYEVVNPTDQRIYVAHRLVQARAGGAFATLDQPIVMNQPGSPGTVAIVLGRRSSDRPSTVVHAPVFRPVEPGARSAHALTLASPLTAFHPVGGASPLPEDARDLVFELQYFVGEPAGWTTYPSTSESIQVPEGTRFETFASQPVPIPR
jgi:hypothetical protein